MPKRKATAVWNGPIKEGQGTLELESGAFSGQYSFSSRFEEGTGTNPEELIAAAHAGCFAMAFSGNLGRAGHQPERIDARAEVHLEKVGDGFGIPRIHLVCEGKVPGIDEATFQEVARQSKEGCPVSKVLAGAEITLDAKLL
jgi:osmotically inducible protein OsmC